LNCTKSGTRVLEDQCLSRAGVLVVLAVQTYLSLITDYRSGIFRNVGSSKDELRIDGIIQ